MTLVGSWLATMGVFFAIFLVGYGFKISERRRKEAERQRLTSLAEQSIAAEQQKTAAVEAFREEIRSLIGERRQSRQSEPPPRAMVR